MSVPSKKASYTPPKEPVLKKDVKASDCSGKGPYTPGPGDQQQNILDFGFCGSDSYTPGPQHPLPSSVKTHHYYGQFPTHTYASYASMY